MNTLDPFGEDIARRCRWAIDHNDGHTYGAWSTSERLAVALVLGDHEHLTAMDYTPTEAAQRIYSGMVSPPEHFNAWLRAIRTSVFGMEGPTR